MLASAGRLGNKVAETLPSGTVRDHRVEGLAGVPRADQRPPHRIGEQHLPLDGADRENREAAAVRELAEPVAEVALPLPAQLRDPVWRDLVEEAFRNIEAPDVLKAVQQPVGVGGIVTRLELPEPDEPRHAGVGRLFEQMLEVTPKPEREPIAYGVAARRTYTRPEGPVWLECP